MKRKPATFTWYLPAWCWLALSLYLFTIPGTALPSSGWMDNLQIDKLVHLFLFAVMVVLFSRPALAGVAPLPRNALHIGIPMACIAYGVAIEFVQLYWSPLRGFEVWDIAADTAGSLLGAWLAPRLVKRRHQPIQSPGSSARGNGR